MGKVQKRRYRTCGSSTISAWGVQLANSTTGVMFGFLLIVDRAASPGTHHRGNVSLERKGSKSENIRF